jgi:hypothetical protein
MALGEEERHPHLGTLILFQCAGGQATASPFGETRVSRDGLKTLVDLNPRDCPLLKGLGLGKSIGGMGNNKTMCGRR